MIHPSVYGELKIFSGGANPCLARKICEYLDHPLENLIISRHSDGEIYVRYPQSIRGADVFIIQPTHYPQAENLMELLMLTDA
ncbi:MAG: ribose-phosphate pyrophosphokinase-like domain-containing protein, partial [bacterium]|nr:ribose-phosphate pyrophosphokinase-like domain-containing protein [bacterium]